MDIFLSNQVQIFLFSESIIYLISLIAFIASIVIVKEWNFNSTSPKQYKLEKRSFLIMTIIVLTLWIKIALLAYFVYTIDSISVLIPGAMCAAGVISANQYGNPLLFLKIALLFLTGIWLILNSLDQKAEDYPYFKTKLWFYIAVFLLLSAEFYLDFAYFSHISTDDTVQCCSAIFGLSGDNHIPLNLNVLTLLAIFYILYILTVLLSIQRYPFTLFVISLLFLYFAYQSVVHFFGTYIYELPSHKCPFCMLQKEYGFVGYFLWGTLFLGVFFGISNFILKILISYEDKRLYRFTIIFNTIFVILCTLYVLIYYIRNGVWL